MLSKFAGRTSQRQVITDQEKFGWLHHTNTVVTQYYNNHLYYITYYITYITTIYYHISYITSHITSHILQQHSIMTHLGLFKFKTFMEICLYIILCLWGNRSKEYIHTYTSLTLLKHTTCQTCLTCAINKTEELENSTDNDLLVSHSLLANTVTL